jgi:hypothetical protein
MLTSPALDNLAAAMVRACRSGLDADELRGVDEPVDGLPRREHVDLSPAPARHSGPLVAEQVNAAVRAFTHLWAVAIAAVVGFAGNEIVARYRIRVGRRIGNAALVIGLVITVAILGVLRSAVRQVGARLMDAVDPALVDQATIAVTGVAGEYDPYFLGS